MKVLARCGWGGLIAGMIGWFIYSWVLEFSYPYVGVSLVSNSIHDVVLHKVTYAASVSLLGVVIGFYSNKGLKVISVLLMAALALMSLWTLFVRHRLAALHNTAQEAFNMSVLRLDIHAVPIFEAGVVAALFVVLAMSILSWMKKR
jgi:hypothetical protein